MSIHILPQEVLLKQKQSVGVVKNIPLLHLPKLQEIYQIRAQRLQTLIDEQHPFADYLTFVLRIVQAQHYIAEQTDLLTEITAPIPSSYQEHMPFHYQHLPDYSYWQMLLVKLIEQLKHDPLDTVQHALKSLKQSSAKELDDMAELLLSQQFEKVDSQKSVFIWAALMLYWSALAATFNGDSERQQGEQITCPLCSAPPVASVIKHDEDAGLRYLHCSLCETQWYYTRAKCTHCAEMSDLNYYYVDSEENHVKAECCEHCKSYLKVMVKAKLPSLDVVTDDLASLVLDAMMEENDSVHSGLNPFLFYSDKPS